ncbi:MAG TPA: chemotaxis protein CheA [Acidobacteriaceae bacterium]|nr:chemotaxis protein CheA [Acidobacteriaceae bacterium]
MTGKGNNPEAFRAAFREEAREILVDLEASLLELNEKPGDTELVGRVFRALHTIKGSGAMFGFDDLAAFTHNLENAFDEVRKGRLAVTPELVDLALSALDRIRAMVEAQAGEPAADRDLCAKIIERVRAVTGGTSRAAEQSARPEAPSAGGTDRIAVEESQAEHRWRIDFAPGPELTRNGADPLLLLRELRQMGRLAVRAHTDALPPLDELDPVRCYARWEMTLTTTASADAIRDVFIFVEDVCELTLTADDPAGEPAAQAQAEPRAPAVTGKAPEEKRNGEGRRAADKSEAAASLRVPASRLDALVDLVGELVTVQARLSELAARVDDADVVAVSEEIERLTSALRENSMTLRMLPVRATFEKFRRLVHDLARDLGKDAELTVEGAETEMDKTVLDALGDPLMHLIRNSMDHGIETPGARATAGKPRTAHIHLSARHSGASVLIGVSDDGGGIDTDAVRCRAVERGLVSAEAVLSEQEIYSLLFQPGFSTARVVTGLSGRGVGMDVVRQRVESLRGSIDVASRPGAGTTVTLRLPLTLAIIDGLLVSVGNALFVLPLASTLECIELTRAEGEQANGRQVANVRGEIVPYIRLRQYFAMKTPAPEREQIMVVESDEGRCGLVVDQVLGDCQTVIRSLGRLYRHVQVVSGATILGNGAVALILDAQRLVQEAARAKSPAGRPRPCPSTSGSSPPQGNNAEENTKMGEAGAAAGGGQPAMS